MRKENEPILLKLGRSCLCSFLVSATATYIVCSLIPKKKIDGSIFGGERIRD